MKLGRIVFRDLQLDFKLTNVEGFTYYLQEVLLYLIGKCLM